MATNQTGIAIVIKAWLPAGKSLDEQFEALSLVKTAHETSDYSALLAASRVEEVKTEQKTRRMEDPDVTAQENPAEHAAVRDDLRSDASDPGSDAGDPDVTEAA